MQTFLPHPNFVHSVAVLDRQRLGKQRVECQQIFTALIAEASMPVGWTNHPATLMWKGYESALAIYMTCCINEWILRGYENNMMPPYDSNWRATVGWHPEAIEEDARKASPPAWLGNDTFHSSHKAALLHKDLEHYSKFGWCEEPKLDYFWPTKQGY